MFARRRDYGNFPTGAFRVDPARTSLNGPPQWRSWVRRPLTGGPRSNLSRSQRSQRRLRRRRCAGESWRGRSSGGRTRKAAGITRIDKSRPWVGRTGRANAIAAANLNSLCAKPSVTPRRAQRGRGRGVGALKSPPPPSPRWGPVHASTSRRHWRRVSRMGGTPQKVLLDRRLALSLSTPP
jgi:hypothetical protein